MMFSTVRRLAVAVSIAAGLFAFAAAAQDPQAQACPQLPPGSGLDWNQRSSGNFLVCRAVAGDGSEAFGLSISSDSAFQPRRANREERGVIAGQNIRWYSSRDPAGPGVLVRETLVELDADRVVHIWMRTPSQAQLEHNMRLVEALHFSR